MGWNRESKRHSLASQGIKTGRFVKPMLLHRHKGELSDKPDWFGEIKHDGVRALIHKDGDRVWIQNRQKRDVTNKFPEIVAEIQKLSGNFIIDGELVIIDSETGKENEHQVVGKHHRERDKHIYKDILATFFIFDVLSNNDEELISLPIEERKKILSKIVKDSSLLKIVEMEEDEKALFDKTRGKYEGIVIKRKGSKYFTDTRSRDWLKGKHQFEKDVFIVGYTEGEGHREDAFGALIVATKENGVLTPRGKVGTGFTDVQLMQIKKQLDKVPEKQYPFRFKFRDAERFFNPIAAKIKVKDEGPHGNYVEPVFIKLK